MTFRYDYNQHDYAFENIEKMQKVKIETIPDYEDSKEVKLEKVFQGFVNELYEKIDDEEAFRAGVVEEVLIKNINRFFNKTHTAKLTGLSIRTVRNKLNEYGSRNLQ
ncbi:MAG: helix-turn-helix domain-containing protein [Bacteriovoracaceae bacterium]